HPGYGRRAYLLRSAVCRKSTDPWPSEADTVLAKDRSETNTGSGALAMMRLASRPFVARTSSAASRSAAQTRHRPRDPPGGRAHQARSRSVRSGLQPDRPVHDVYDSPKALGAPPCGRDRRDRTRVVSQDPPGPHTPPERAGTSVRRADSWRRPDGI